MPSGLHCKGLTYKSSKTPLQTYRAASDPYATPTHTTNSAQFTAIRNTVLSTSELYFASNIVFSPLASIDDGFALSLVDTRKNLVKFRSGMMKLFFTKC